MAWIAALGVVLGVLNVITAVQADDSYLDAIFGWISSTAACAAIFASEMERRGE